MEMIKSLKGIGYDTLFEAFSEAFKDYEMQVNKAEFIKLIERRGFVPELSFAAFIDDRIVSFTLNGIGTSNRLKTAYDTGTGTIEEFRGQGLASKIFQYSIPFLKEAGVAQYLLEVLQHNTKAVSMYEKQGFNVSREFNYYKQKGEDIQLGTKSALLDFQLNQIDLSLTKPLTDFFDFAPSWQNSFESIVRKPDDFIVLGAQKEHQLLGFCILEPGSGDITQIVVDRRFRRKGIGTQLLKTTLNFNRHPFIKVINTEIHCDSLNGFLKYHSISLQGKQFEMIKPL